MRTLHIQPLIQTTKNKNKEFQGKMDFIFELSFKGKKRLIKSTKF